MTSNLINAAVTALAHDRLRVLFEAIGRKRRVAEGRFRDPDAPVAPGLRGHSGIRDDDPAFLTQVPVSVVEKQVQELARRALEILETSSRAPAPPGLPRTGGTSRFALLGSTAFDLPGLRSEHRWVSRTVRRGGHDGHLSFVTAPATAVAYATGSAAVIGASPQDAWAARAFAMGMITGQAANVIVNPLLHGTGIPRDVEDRDVNPQVLARAESALKAHLFRGLDADQLQGWWPEPSALTDGLLNAYIGALVSEAHIDAPPGFSDVTLARGRVLDPSILRNTYYLTRNETSWSGWLWLAYLLLFSVPVGLALPIAASARGGRWKAHRYFLREAPGAPGPDEEALAQMIMLSSSLATVGPFVTNLILWSKLPEPNNGPFIGALVANILDLVSAGFLALSQTGSDNDGWVPVRWITILAQAAFRIVFFIFSLTEPAGFPARHWGIQTFPLWATFGCLIATWIISAIVDAASSDTAASNVVIVGIVVWSLILLCTQIVFSVKLDGTSLTAAVIGARPPPLVDLAGLPPNDDPPYALAMLHDESTLWADPAAPPAITVPDLRYPPGSRPILKMWWTLDSDLQVRHGGHQLSFRIGTGAAQDLALPPVAFTPAELAAYLSANVTGRPAGTPGPSGGLVCKVAIDGDSPMAAHRLPFPQVVEVTADYVSVGRNEANAYPLRHARRMQLATPHGHRGPAVSVAEGWPVAPGPGAGGSDGTGIGMAADLASLLALGAASRLHPGPASFPDPAGPIALPARVSQVFRQWNLDERRVNEWRMLVAGGAASEKPARAPVPPTEAVPGDGAQLAPGGASPPVLIDTERLANALGWVPAFRAWQRIASDPVEDCASDRPAPYNPILRFNAGVDMQPSNQQLNDVIRYLLDLP